MENQIVIKSNNSMILTAPVMIPGAKDCDYFRGEDPFTVDQVRVFKELYDEYGFIDDYHGIRDEYSADKGKLRGNALKSFLLSEPTSYVWFDGTVHTYPAGTWMLTSEITDPVTMKSVQEGKITGYSPSIFPRPMAEKIKAALKGEISSLKASLGGLIKDMSDPVPAIVSLVRSPCQHGNKFCKHNLNDGENMSDDNKAQSKLNQIRSILGGNTPEYAMKEDLDGIKEYVDAALKANNDHILDAVKDTVAASIKDALTVPAIKEDGNKEDDDDDSNKEGDTGNSEGGQKPADKGDNGTSSNKDNDSNKEDDDNKNKPAVKSDDGSKALPLHDDGGSQPVLKSDAQIVFEIMGLDSKGRPKKN